MLWICASVKLCERSREELSTTDDPVKLPSAGAATAAGTVREAMVSEVAMTVERLRELEAVMFTPELRLVLPGSFG